jgi:hypothetical protein
LQTNITAEASARAAADSTLSARAFALETYVDTIPVFENTAGVYADGEPGSLDPSGRSGWYFKNSVASSKINWYLFDGTRTPATLDGLSGYAVVTMDSTASAQRPFFSIYTMPTGTGDALPGFAKSRRVYVTNPSTVLSPGLKYFFYFGTDSGAHPEVPSARRIPMTTSAVPGNQLGSLLASEAVYTVACSSSATTANTVSFVVEATGFVTSSFRQESALMISSRLSPVQTVSASASVSLATDVVIASAAASSVVITLPQAAMNRGRKILVKRSDDSANACSVAAASGQTIDGSASYALLVQFDSVTVISDGSNWFVV